MVAACWGATNLEHVRRTSTSASATFNFPTGYQSGHLLVVTCAISCFDSLPTSPSTPSGWTQLHDYGGGPYDAAFKYARFVAFAKVLDGTEGGSISLTSGGTTFQGWSACLVWIDAKLNGDEQGGWFDDWDVASGGTSVAALTASRNDTLCLYSGMAFDNTGHGTPTGFCNLELGSDGGGDQDHSMSVKCIAASGSTGAIDAGGNGTRAAIAMLIPANGNPCGGSGPFTLRPVVGYIGFG